MDSNTPFEEAKKQCSNFVWNLLSTIQMNKTIETINLENEEHKVMFDALIEQHCKHLVNEVQQ